MARNAKDNVVSYFHFDRMNFVQPEPGDWNNYLHRFMEGKCMYDRAIVFGTEMHRFLLMFGFFHELFCCFSGVWILV